jgi:N-glycosidase YbiA
MFQRIAIYFYSSHEEPYGSFSNFSRHGIEMDGTWWPTVEHYFQAQKFVGTPHAAKIQQAATPKQAAEMGRSRALPLRPDWEDIKDDVMFRAVFQKFKTHQELQTLLLNTGEEEIVESAPSDYYWGCGSDGSGQNKLGKILMEVRHLLAHS